MIESLDAMIQRFRDHADKLPDAPFKAELDKAMEDLIRSGKAIFTEDNELALVRKGKH